ncbi:hypothetical protein BDA99DRAFT_492737 [Phascolomyces articulosus]|uniref:Uncharacterized protein n=1 Tax=Phascolomyces articulosus TaxID=60185 RepID=A0AAD5KZV3_9FUNG|nr:hypothetical protein BDA99DRAFT_492737 [Phascolomyces articulosus]
MTVVPIPPKELPVLENLITVRHKLSALKKDRDSSARSEEILPLYYETEKQVESLANLRSDDIWDPKARNRLNDVLDDVMSLLSLFFMSLGRNRESPAVYVHLVTVERYLEQLTQMGIYTDTILVEIEERVADVESIINAGNTEVASSFLDLLKKKLLRSKHELNELLATIRDISPELKPVHNELVAIRRDLGSIASRPSGFSSNDIIPFQVKVRQIDKEFHEKCNSLAGRGVVEGLLEQLYEETHDLIASSENISISLIPLADRLKDIKSQLERLAFTHRWTLRETDLYMFQLQLQEIEKLRDDGKFKDTEGNVAEGQTVINFLLRGCYRLITKMLSENVPVAEALMPVHNQLSTVRRCLVEVTKCGKPDSPRDLYPYQMKLASIDNMRVNGIFYDEDNNIPEGQAICTALLNECYDILHDLISAIA